MSRRNRLDLPQQNSIVEILRQSRGDGLGVGDRLEAVQMQKCLEFGGKGEAPLSLQHIERLHAEPISRQEQAPLPPIPNGEAPHSIEAQQAVGPPAFVGS
jgi:hypothetical protein